MNQEMVKVTIDGKEHEYAIGTTYREIVDEYQEEVAEAPVILVMADGKLRELQKKLKGDCTLEFVTTKDHIGFETYKRTVCLVLLRAIYDVAGKENIEKVMIHYSVGNGYYFTMAGKAVLDQHFLDNVKTRMQELADMCTPIGKRSVNTDDAVSLFHHHRMYDKEKLFRFRRVSKVNIYNIGYYEDYFYGYMADHAGYVKYFDLKLYDEGFVLELPTRKNPSVISAFRPEGKIFQVQKESQEWAEKMDISYVGDLNDHITKEGISNILLVQEALQEAKISDIAQRIVLEGNKKFIMIADVYKRQTLNRVYTEWYRNKGKDFTITSSTAYDHKWIRGRNVFDSISRITDELFENYLSRPDVRQPILTQYCDGRMVQCRSRGWMTQWGSKSLGDQGYSPIEILRYFYGNDMYINVAEEISGIPSSWPGYDLNIGATGEKVRQLQEQLNVIAGAYPAIPKVGEDGIYGERTSESVRKFQNVFGLPETGITDYPTWYKIQEIYVAVSRIAELN